MLLDLMLPSCDNDVERDPQAQRAPAAVATTVRAAASDRVIVQSRRLLPGPSLSGCGRPVRSGP